jgi:hypothetical protein
MGKIGELPAAMHTGRVIRRWRLQFPEEFAKDPDPRDGQRRCIDEGCEALAWRRYGGLCGWCYEGLLDRARRIDAVRERAVR